MGDSLPYLDNLLFRVKSYIGYLKSQILVTNMVRVLGSGPHTPTNFSRSTPPPPWGSIDRLKRL